MDLRLGLSLSTSSSHHSFHGTTNYTYDERQDESDDPQYSSSFSVNQIEEDDEEGIVGWPPVKWRRRRAARQDPTVENGCRDCEGIRLSKSKYVKVKMEGVAIARKIDLTNFNSFQELMQILIGMFGIFENSGSYKLIYQDREGDWLVAENVSWRNFMESVQRLKLIRKGSCSINTTS